MNGYGNGIFWFEFLLNPSLLPQHLTSTLHGNAPDPGPIPLITQFVQNAEKWNNEASEDALEKLSRSKKSRVLKKLALQTAAFLNWDLEALAALTLPVQQSFYKYVLELGSANTFLSSLYHRWILATTKQPPKRSNVPGEDGIVEGILRSCNPEQSIQELKSLLETLAAAGVTEISIPDFTQSFEKETEIFDNDSPGTRISLASFCSLVNLDLGVYFLYKGNIPSGREHFKLQKIPTQNFPWLEINEEKLQGYLRAVGLAKYEQIDDGAEEFNVDEEKELGVIEVGKLLRKGQLTGKLEKLLNMNLRDSMRQPEYEALNPDNIDVEEVENTVFSLEKRLLETSDLVEIKDLLIQLHSLNSPAAGGPGSVNRSFSKLFSSFEIPIPIQHGTQGIVPGPFQDYIYILVAKSIQLLNIKLFSDSRSCLLLAQTELTVHLQTVAQSMTPYLMTITKLKKMLDWEVLFIELCQLFQEWPKFDGNLIPRAKDCLHCFKNKLADINPRSEIIENILMGLINIGDYETVSQIDQHLQQQMKWPFLEFLCLLAKVCQDLVERKDSSSNYRELWYAVLPLFTLSNPNSVRRNPPKVGILSSRSMLQWVIERSKSHLTVQLFVSLFGKLHNHIIDDIGLQVQTEFLHIWPSTMDDVTINTDVKTRVSGSSKLNAKQIRDILFQLLKSPTGGSGEVTWLKVAGDVHLASGNPMLAMKGYVEYLALSTDFFEKHSVAVWSDNGLFRRMIKCCELMQAFTQVRIECSKSAHFHLAVVLCQFLTEIDYTMTFGMAQEKITADAGDSLYGFIWDLTVLEFLVNLHSKRNENMKKQQALKVMGLLELNSNNNEEIQREAMHLRKSQFMRTLAKLYVFI